MMKYLYKIFREFNGIEFEEHYHKRINFETYQRLPFHIRPINVQKSFQLYFIPTVKMLMSISELFHQDKILTELFNKIPDIAKQNFLFDCLVEELQNTNELEGVRSSKEEIVRSAREFEKDALSKDRFTSLINSYNKLVSGTVRLLEKPSDVRKIYDDLVLDEIAKNEWLDGEIFRKEVTNVYKNSGTGKIIHKGITPEKEIIKSIEEMIFFLNKENSIPAILRIAIAHYYFGYIHPFYDGNGRTSRFISSMYLNKELSLLSAISLSRGCNQHRSQYLEAFEKSNSIINRGEMNYFLDTFLEILISAQGDLIEQLKLKKGQLDLAEKSIHDHPFLQKANKQLYKDIVYVMAQHHFFDVSGEGMTVQQLAKMYKKSEQHIRKLLKELEENQLLTTKGTRPVYYFLNEEFLY